MRKTLVFFLVLALVCGCGVLFAARAVSAPRADVTFREEIVSGEYRSYYARMYGERPTL